MIDPVANWLGIRPSEHRARVAEERLVRMRDGVGLHTVRISPRPPGSHPTILIRSPYGVGWRTAALFTRPIAYLFASRGYHVVLQDTRGRHRSGGEFYPFVHEQRDGEDTLAWIADQPFFNGTLGLWGPSYLGYTQLALAARAPPFLKAMVPMLTSSNFYELFYPNGAFSLYSALRWGGTIGRRRGTGAKQRQLGAAVRARPSKDAARRLGSATAFFEDWADHPACDAYWQAINFPEARHANTVPTLSIAGTYDIFCASQLADFAADEKATLVLGPFGHGSWAISARRLGWRHCSTLRMLRPSLDFLDHHLQGRNLERQRVSRYVIGADTWEHDDAWPPLGTRPATLYLRSSGRLDHEPAGCDEAPDRYLYDPGDPTPSLGGTFLGPGCGPADQRPLQHRSDVLCYDTPPLTSRLQIAGHVKLELTAETDAPATDFCAKLVHLPADQRRPAINLCSGIERVVEAAAGPMQLEIDMWAASAEIAAGDRLRLEISSANFPRYDAHPNVRGNTTHAQSHRIARQHIHHSVDRTSRLVLPVLD